MHETHGGEKWHYVCTQKDSRYIIKATTMTTTNLSHYALSLGVNVEDRGVEKWDRRRRTTGEDNKNTEK